MAAIAFKDFMVRVVKQDDIDNEKSSNQKGFALIWLGCDARRNGNNQQGDRYTDNPADYR